MRWLSGFSDLAPTARPRRARAREGLARWDGAGAVGYVALAEALDRELDAAPDGARLVVVSSTASPPVGWAGSPSASPAAGSSAC